MTCIDVAINKHYARWLSHCRGLKKNQEDGEDLLHDILTELHTKGRIEQLACEQEGKGIYTYVCRMIWTRHIDDVKRMKIEVVRGMNTDWVADTTPEEEPASWMLEQTDIYVSWLTDYEVELIEFSKMPGFSTRMVSRLTGITARVIATDLRNAKKKLKQYVHNTTKNKE